MEGLANESRTMQLKRQVGRQRARDEGERRSPAMQGQRDLEGLPADDVDIEQGHVHLIVGQAACRPNAVGQQNLRLVAQMVDHRRFDIHRDERIVLHDEYALPRHTASPTVPSRAFLRHARANQLAVVRSAPGDNVIDMHLTGRVGEDPPVDGCSVKDHPTDRPWKPEPLSPGFRAAPSPYAIRWPPE